MSGLEELRKKLAPLFDAEKGFSSNSTLDPYDSYTVRNAFLLIPKQYSNLVILYNLLFLI